VKKLLCVTLILGIMLWAMPAMADMSLYDVWFESTWSVPEHTSKKQVSKTNNGRYIDGFWVGEVTNSMLDCAQYLPYNNDSGEDVICAWLEGTCNPELPLFEILAENIEHVNVMFDYAEFYSYYDGREEVAISEFYSVDVTLETPYGMESCGMICHVWMDRYGEQGAEYFVTFGDLDGNTWVGDSSTVNYMGNLVVVNCEEWVSLRAQPSTKSERMTKVPLHALVKDCYLAGDGFVFCTYNNMQGFILEEYLDYGYH